jgi:hypothetical protein
MTRLATLAAAALVGLGLSFASVPVQAATIGQVLQQVHDIFDNHCSGNPHSLSCSVSHESSQDVTVDLPDIPTKVLVTPAVPADSTGISPSRCNGELGYWHAIPMPGGKVFCVAASTADFYHNGSAAVYKIVIVDGGTTVETEYSCTTTTGSISHSGSNPATGWSLNVSTDTSSGHCS